MVILRLGSVAMLDATGARVLGEIVEHLHRQGITVLVKGASDEHRRLLAAVGTLAPLVERGHVFATFPEAVAHAASTSPPTPHADGGHGPSPRARVRSQHDQQVMVVTPTAERCPTVPNERVSCDRRRRRARPSGTEERPRPGLRPALGAS